MDALLMSEVEQEISRILNKNKQQQQQQTEDYCNKKNVAQCLKNLTQEFDYFDVNCLKEPSELTSKQSLISVLVDLINSCYNLIQLHRELQKKEDNLEQKNSRLSSDVKSLNKIIESLRKDLSVKETQLKISKEKSVLDKLENDELKNRINTAKKQMNLIQRDNISEKNRHKHEMQKMVTDSQRLENKFRNNCGQYISKEKHIASVMNEYKQNEVRHTEMIDKLQDANQELLAEIVSLKEDLLIATNTNDTQQTVVL